MCADDTAITITSNNLNTLEYNLNEIIKKIIDWSNFNKLSVNILKTKYMLLSPLNKGDLVVKMGENTIERVYTFKYLGIHLDENLRFNYHVQQLGSKLSRLAGLSYRLGKIFDIGAARNFYYSFVFSILTYGISTWGGRLMIYSANRLQRLQNKIVKNLFYVHLRNDINYLYESLNLLKVKNMYIYYSMELFYNIKFNNYCTTINSVVQYNPYTYNFRHISELIVPFPRIDIIKVNFKYQFSFNWNTIPNDIRNCENAKKFKKALKMYLLQVSL